MRKPDAVFLSFLCLAAVALVAPALAAPTGNAMPPLYVGVTQVDFDSGVKMNGARSVIVYAFVFNRSREPVEVNRWRLLGADQHVVRCVRGPRGRTLKPGQIMLLWPSFEDNQVSIGSNSYTLVIDGIPVAAVARTTNMGDFSELPSGVQDRITNAMRRNIRMRWWESTR